MIVTTIKNTIETMNLLPTVVLSLYREDDNLAAEDSSLCE